jgi:hypothetical protein
MWLLNETVSTSEVRHIHNRMRVFNAKLVIIWKESFVIYVKVLFRNSFEWTGKSCTPQPG